MKKLLVIFCLVYLGVCMAQERPIIDRLWNWNDAKVSEENFKKALTENSDAELDYQLQIKTQIARSQGLQMKYDEALKTLEDVKSNLNDETKTAKMRYLLEHGRVLNSSGKKEGAKVYFLKAWEYGLEQKLELLGIDAAHMMGIVEVPEKQITWSENALSIAEKSTNPRVKGWLGPLYNNLGWSYHDMKNYDKALELFSKGLEFRKTQQNPQATQIAKWTIARTYRSLERFDEALDLQQKIEKENIELNLPADGYNYEELAELYAHFKKDDLAKKYYKKAYDNFSKDPWMQQNETEHLDRLNRLSK